MKLTIIVGPYNNGQKQWVHELFKQEILLYKLTNIHWNISLSSNFLILNDNIYFSNELYYTPTQIINMVNSAISNYKPENLYINPLFSSEYDYITLAKYFMNYKFVSSIKFEFFETSKNIYEYNNQFTKVEKRFNFDNYTYPNKLNLNSMLKKANVEISTNFIEKFDYFTLFLNKYNLWRDSNATLGSADLDDIIYISKFRNLIYPFSNDGIISRVYYDYDSNLIDKINSSAKCKSVKYNNNISGYNYFEIKTVDIFEIVKDEFKMKCI